MRLPTTRHRAGILILCVLAAFGCANDPVTPESAAFGKAPAAPNVTAASPNSAPQDTTLDVQVLGSGFDRGSKAEWALAGVVDPAKVRTNSTAYVSSTELRANITISLDALVASYDVIVTTSTGKKGVGTEMFVVRSKVIDPGIAPTGTLDAPANAINGLNANGWLVGTVDGSPRRGYVVPPGSTTPSVLPSPGTASVDAWYIADNNIIAGVQGGPAFVWRPTTSGDWDVEILPVPSGLSTDGLGARLNKSGTLGARGSRSPSVPLLWDLTTTPATVRMLATPAATYSTIATAVNDAGTVVGGSTATSSARPSAVYWPGPDAAMVQLPVYPGANSQGANAINNAGVIAGWVSVPLNRTTSARYVAIWMPASSGVYTSAPTLISADGASDPKLNEAGDVLYREAGIVYLWRPEGRLKLAPLSGSNGDYTANATSRIVTGETRVVGYSIAFASGTQVNLPTIWTVP